MTPIEGRDYVEMPQVVADILRHLPVERTGAALSSAQGDLTFITTRIRRDDQVINNLPCVIVGINGEQRVRYAYEGNTLDRGMPLFVLIMTPDYAFMDGIEADQADTYAQAADDDINTLYGDVESLLNSDQARRIVGKSLLLRGGQIAPDPLAFEGRTHIRVRSALLLLTVTNKVRGH
jgi:hypothetical protein